MKILLVEDDGYKSAAIEQWIKLKYLNIDIELAGSYRDGCIKALEGSYDLLILDMTLPGRIQKAGSAKDTIANGGELIISEMLDENIHFKAVILTQYETFNGETIEAINERLMNLCGDSFCGCISYNSQDDRWKDNLKIILDYVEGSNS